MRVLVTGHQGKIGTKLVPWLQDEHEVRGSDIKSGGDILAEGWGENAMYDYHPEVIIHLAAQTSVQDSVEDPWTDARNNILGTVTVLQVAREIGCKVVLAASAGTVYDIRSPYGLSKKTSAEYATLFNELYEDVEVTTLGIGNVYGPGMGGVVREFIEAEKLSRPGTQNPPGCVIFGDGSAQRDFIFIEDVLMAFDAAVKTWKSGYYEVASGNLHTVWEVFRLLTYEWGYTPKLVYQEALPGEVKGSPPLRCDLPWTPRTLEEGLKKTVSGG